MSVRHVEVRGLDNLVGNAVVFDFEEDADPIAPLPPQGSLERDYMLFWKLSEVEEAPQSWSTFLKKLISAFFNGVADGIAVSVQSHRITVYNVPQEQKTLVVDIINREFEARGEKLNIRKKSRIT